MRTLKRPMFRKGGEVGGGIMTGVMRENYDDGTPRPSERIQNVMKEYSAPDRKSTRLNSSHPSRSRMPSSA